MLCSNTHTRLQPVRAHQRARDPYTPANISPPPHQAPTHEQIGRLAARAPARRERDVARVEGAAKDVVLGLAPHYALRDIGLCEYDCAEGGEHLCEDGGWERGGVADIGDVADGGVAAGDMELVFDGYGQAVEGPAVGGGEGVEFCGAGEGGGEEGLGQCVCLRGDQLIALPLQSLFRGELTSCLMIVDLQKVLVPTASTLTI